MNVLENSDLYNAVRHDAAKSLAMHVVERLFNKAASLSFKERYTKVFAEFNVLLFMPTRDGVPWSMLDALFSSGAQGSRSSSSRENRASSPSGPVVELIPPEQAHSTANPSTAHHAKVASSS